MTGHVIHSTDVVDADPQNEECIVALPSCFISIGVSVHEALVYLLCNIPGPGRGDVVIKSRAIDGKTVGQDGGRTYCISWSDIPSNLVHSRM